MDNRTGPRGKRGEVVPFEFVQVLYIHANSLLSTLHLGKVYYFDYDSCFEVRFHNTRSKLREISSSRFFVVANEAMVHALHQVKSSNYALKNKPGIISCLPLCFRMRKKCKTFCWQWCWARLSSKRISPIPKTQVWWKASSDWQWKTRLSPAWPEKIQINIPPIIVHSPASLYLSADVEMLRAVSMCHSVVWFLVLSTPQIGVSRDR